VGSARGGAKRRPVALGSDGEVESGAGLITSRVSLGSQSLLRHRPRSISRVQPHAKSSLNRPRRPASALAPLDRQSRTAPRAARPRKATHGHGHATGWHPRAPELAAGPATQAPITPFGYPRGPLGAEVSGLPIPYPPRRLGGTRSLLGRWMQAASTCAPAFRPSPLPDPTRCVWRGI
jgi:hypothetical protein